MNTQIRVIIIGAGFAGLGAAVKVKEAGFTAAGPHMGVLVAYATLPGPPTPRDEVMG